jgi:hypothetical protein
MAGYDEACYCCVKSLLCGCVKRMAGYGEACCCCVKSLLCGCVAWFGLALAWSFIFLRISRGSGGFPPPLPSSTGFPTKLLQKKKIVCIALENIFILRILNYSFIFCLLITSDYR